MPAPTPGYVKNMICRSLREIVDPSPTKKNVEGQRLIVSHKVGFRNELEITDKGIRDRRQLSYSVYIYCRRQ